MRWRPRAPQHVLKVTRDGELSWLGVITSVGPSAGQGDALQVNGQSYEVLLADLPLPYSPPGAERSDDPDGFEFWWRQLVYVFDLENPRVAPPLPAPLRLHERHTIERFIRVTQALAASTTASATGRIEVHPSDDGESETVVTDFPSLDAQVGFAGLLRQCNNREEAAAYDRVRDILWMAARAAHDRHSDERLDRLKAWQTAIKSLRKKSLDQLVRDRFVSAEGWKVFDWTEQHSPEQLLATFNYGDLLHWGGTRARMLDPTGDEYNAAYQRHSHLKAALGLAHVFIGFAELARALTTPLDELLLPS